MPVDVVEPTDGRRRSTRVLVPAALVALVIAGALMVWFFNRQEPSVPTPSVAPVISTLREFPDLSGVALSAGQERLVSSLREEHTAQQPPTRYSAGVEEPWCADFISWNMRAAGMPLSNPHTGAWRIPGTLTLAQYYRSAGRFRTPDSGYQPAVGDLVFYSAQSPFGRHVSMVLTNDRGVLTTIGGNENDRVRIRRVQIGKLVGVTGFGLLPRT